MKEIEIDAVSFFREVAKIASTDSVEATLDRIESVKASYEEFLSALFQSAETVSDVVLAYNVVSKMFKGLFNFKIPEDYKNYLVWWYGLDLRPRDQGLKDIRRQFNGCIACTERAHKDAIDWLREFVRKCDSGFFKAISAAVAQLPQGVMLPETSIDELGLSPRAYGCLSRANILTVAALLECSENDLLNIRNFGERSIKEIVDKLAGYGLSLKEE